MPSSLNVDSGDAAKPQKPVRRLVTRIYLTTLRLFIVTIALAPVRTGAMIDDSPCPCCNEAVPASRSSQGAGSAFQPRSFSSNGAGSACSSLRYRATGLIFRCGESLITSSLSPDVHDNDDHVDRSSIVFDTYEKVAACLCMEASDETVPLCLDLITGIPVTNDMKVTPMGYMENVNFQYIADDDRSTIPPTYSFDPVFTFFTMNVCDEYGSSAFTISPTTYLFRASLWSADASTHCTFVSNDQQGRLTIATMAPGAPFSVEAAVRSDVCSTTTHTGDSNKVIPVMSVIVRCMEMNDLNSYDQTDVTSDVSFELTDDRVLLPVEPMISPWPHWREIRVDIESFNYNQPAVMTTNSEFNDLYLLTPGNSVTHVHIDNTYGFYELDLEHYMVFPVNDDDLNTSASPAYVTYTAYDNEFDTPGEIYYQKEFGTLGGLLPSNDSYDMFSRPSVFDYGAELTGVAEFKRAERECVCDHPYTYQDEGTFFVGARVSSRMYNDEPLRFQIHGDSLV